MHDEPWEARAVSSIAGAFEGVAGDVLWAADLHACSESRGEAPKPADRQGRQVPFAWPHLMLDG